MAKKETVHIDNRVAVPDNSKRRTVLNLENFSEFYTKEAVDELVEQSVLGVASVNTRYGAVVLTKTDVGLSNVLNVNLTPAVDLNTAKVGITSVQASDIVTNNSKISFTEQEAVDLNTAKITFPEASVNHRSYVRNSGEWQLLNEPFSALTDGANISWDANDDSGKINATVTLAGDRILDNPTNLNNGTSYNLIVKQDATGTRLLTYGTLFKWAGGTAPTLSTTPNAVDVFTFVYDGSDLHGSSVGLKQDILVSGTSLKTINGVTLLGSGDISTNSFDKNIIANTSGNYNLDYSDDVTFYKLTLTADTTITESNLPSTLENTTITLKITGNFALTVPTAWGDIDGDSYDGAVYNFYAVQRTDTNADVFLSNKAT